MSKIFNIVTIFTLTAILFILIAVIWPVESIHIR
jgi:hypothetical protein